MMPLEVGSSWPTGSLIGVNHKNANGVIASSEFVSQTKRGRMRLISVIGLGCLSWLICSSKSKRGINRYKYVVKYQGHANAL